MVLITGGAYQGKLAYAKAHFPQMELAADFHETVRTLAAEDKDVLAAVEAMLPRLKDKVVIFPDIFCGVVPTDPFIRRWREDCGRAMALLAKNAEQVIRVFCGIGSRIK